MMTRRQWAIVLIGGLLAVALGFWASNQRLTPAAAAEDVAGELFAQEYPDADGKPRQLAEFRGQVLVVNFWATWCPPCVEEMPDLQKVRDEYKGRGVEVIGIGIDNAQKIRDFRDRLGLTLPLLVAGFGGTELAQSLGNTAGALPYTALVDRSGRVVQRKLGQIKPAELRSWIDAQLR